MQTPTDLVEAWIEACNRADADALAALYAQHANNREAAYIPDALGFARGGVTLSGGDNTT